MIKLYLDIDGVLLTKNHEIPLNALEFINWAVGNYDCYWLTTHCKGNTQTAIKYLRSYYPSDIITKMETIKATNWDILKTEAIDIESNFFWIDDNPFLSEKAFLAGVGRGNQLIHVDLKRIEELVRVMKIIENKII